MMFKILDEVQREYSYSEHSTNLMKEKVTEQLQQVLEIYNDPDEMMVLVELTDYDGNDCFWYLDEFDMYGLLDCRIMDRVIQKKWKGKYDINASIFDYSTSYVCLVDKH